jgi:branched-chain amino acid transport system ATP-binding protein
MAELLRLDSVQAYYGRLRVLHGISFALDEGGITALLGGNGAGKTTLLRAICRMVRTTGHIHFRGAAVDDVSTEDVARRGVAHVPDGRGTFMHLTAHENLRLGAITRRDRSDVERDFELVFSYFPRLKERLHLQAGLLSGGEQQMLAIGRALMLRPKLLLLDEPSFGLAPLVVKEIFTIMRRINREARVSILLVEQNAKLALAIADQAHLIEQGRIVLSGPSHQVSSDETVRRVYLGY